MFLIVELVRPWTSVHFSRQGFCKCWYHKPFNLSGFSWLNLVALVASHLGFSKIYSYKQLHWLVSKSALKPVIGH